jgi:hypothetical protein
VQDNSIQFTRMAETFPPMMKWKDAGVMLAAIVLSGVSVIPNYYFGGTFGVDFAENICKGSCNQEDVRLFSALLSAVVNGYINANSINASVVEISHQGEKFLIPGERVKSFFALLAFLSLAGIASIPNIQFVKDTIKGWTKAETVSMQVIVYLINCSLNFRAITGFWHTAQPRVFGKDNREDASRIRWDILLALNHKLPPAQQIPAYKISSLSKGCLYTDNYAPWIRTSINTIAGLAPAVYSVGAYFFSAEDAMENITNYDNQQNTILDRSKLLLAFSIAGIAMLLKWVFLARANIHATQHLSNAYLATPIITPTSKFSIHSTLWLILHLLHLSIAVLSLTGGMGMVQEYLFDSENTLSHNIASIFITVIAAIGINYLDFYNGNTKSLEFMRRLFVTTFKSTPEINADAFGDNYSDFILKTMLNISQMSDANILGKYTVDKTKQEKTPLLENGHAPFTATAIGYHRETNAAYAEFKQEITNLNAESFANFLQTHNKPADTLVHINDERRELLIVNNGNGF